MSSVPAVSANFIESHFVAPECLAQIELLYQDDHLLVINKPSGLLCTSSSELNTDTVLSRLQAMYPACQLIHRLDFGTSGLLLVALTKQANAHLGKQFQNRTVYKKYLAVLEGHVEAEEGEINFAIARGFSSAKAM